MILEKNSIYTWKNTVSTSWGSGGFPPGTDGGTLEKGAHPHQRAWGEAVSHRSISVMSSQGPATSRPLCHTYNPRTEHVAPRRHGGSLAPLWSHLFSGSSPTDFLCLVDVSVQVLCVQLPLLCHPKPSF